MLTFAELTNDGDGEGAFFLDSLPPRAEAGAIRELAVKAESAQPSPRGDIAAVRNRRKAERRPSIDSGLYSGLTPIKKQVSFIFWLLMWKPVGWEPSMQGTRAVFALGAVTLAGTFASAPAQAQFFTDSTGLASPAQTVDFTIFGLATDEVVTTQPQAYGVTFSPFVYYNPQGGFFPNGRVGNFTFPTEPAFVDPVTLNFTGDLTAAAFEMAADDTPYTFTALLDGTAVASGNATILGSPAFVGFTGVTFNAIEISQAGTGGGPYWLVGNLQFGTSLVAIPEAPTWAMMLFGFAGLGFIGYWSRKAVSLTA